MKVWSELLIEMMHREPRNEGLLKLAIAWLSEYPARAAAPAVRDLASSIAANLEEIRERDG
jgi:hypothetical protein